MKYKLTAYLKPTAVSPAGYEEKLFIITASDINVIIDAMIGREHLRFTLEIIE